MNIFFKILLVVLICAGESFAQFDIDNFGWWNKSVLNKNRATGYVVTLDTSTAYPTAYTNFMMKFVAGQYGRIALTDPLRLTSTITELEIRLDIKRTAGTHIWGFNIVGSNKATNLQFTKSSSIFVLAVGDSLYYVDTLASDGYWITSKFLYSSGSLKYYRNDTLKFTRVTTFPNVTGGTARTFTLGSINEETADGQNNVLGSADYAGWMDNLYIRVKRTTDSVLYNINFDAGVIGQDSANYYQWLGGNQHNHVNANIADGYASMGQDPYEASYVWRSGTRKDTCKYFNLGGLRHYGAFGYTRAAIGKIKTNPFDSTKVVLTGAFSRGRDSADFVGYHVALYNSATNTITDMDTGLSINGFSFDAEFLNSDQVIISGAFDSAGGIPVRKIARYTFSTHTWDSLRGGFDTLSTNGILCHNDTLWILDGQRVKFWTNANNAWTVYYTFGISFGVVTPAIGWGANTVLIGIGESGIWKRENGTFTLWKALTNFTGGYSGGGFSYDAIYQDSRGRTWIGGDYWKLDGVECNGICYIDASGTVHSVGGVSGLTGGYGDFAGQGAFTLDVCSFAELDNKIYFVGGFTRLNGHLSGRNIGAWDETNGLQAVDYGIDYKGQGITAFKNGSYVDLMVAQDGWGFDGLRANLIAGRYSAAHEKVIPPVVTMTGISDMPATQYPPTLTAEVYSPLWRGLTVSVAYHKNYNGSTSTFTMSKTDSNLTNAKAVWSFNYSGAFGGSVTTGDTIFYTLTATDDYGNSKDTSSKFAIIYPDYVATPNYLWDFTDLSDGAVTTWLNQQDTLTLRQSTTANKPVKGSTGVTFDTTDILLSNMPHLPAGDGCTVMLLMSLPDTNTYALQRMFSYRHNTSPVKVLSLQCQNNSTSTYRKLGSSYFDGAVQYNKTFLTNLGSHNLGFAVFTVTNDSVGRNILNVNNTAGTDQGAAFSTSVGSQYFGLGNTESTGGMKNCIIKRIVVYFRKLSTAEILQNYNAMIARP